MVLSLVYSSTLISLCLVFFLLVWTDGWTTYFHIFKKASLNRHQTIGKVQELKQRHKYWETHKFTLPFMSTTSSTFWPLLWEEEIPSSVKLYNLSQRIVMYVNSSFLYLKHLEDTPCPSTVMIAVHSPFLTFSANLLSNFQPNFWRKKNKEHSFWSSSCCWKFFNTSDLDFLDYQTEMSPLSILAEGIQRTNISYPSLDTYRFVQTQTQHF